MGFLGNYYPGMRVNALDLAPNYAGSIIAVTNGFGSLTAIVAPVFVGMMIPDVSNKTQIFSLDQLINEWLFHFSRRLNNGEWSFGLHS